MQKPVQKEWRTPDDRSYKEALLSSTDRTEVADASKERGMAITENAIVGRLRESVGIDKFRKGLEEYDMPCKISPMSDVSLCLRFDSGNDREKFIKSRGAH
ncbi:hypothetical protein PTKIN_Ptkin14bG0045400 [Pterospermum kingtungense]